MTPLLPSSWSVTTVAEVSAKVTVGFVGTQSTYFVESGIPLLRGQNVKPFELDLSSLKFISPATHQKWSKSALGPGDVVIVRVGYPGVAAVIPGGLGELNAASLVIVRTKRSRLNPYFLAYLLNSPWGKSTVAARFVGAAQQVLNTGAVADLEIQLPPIRVQDQIVGVLSAYEELIENNTRRIEILEQMAESIYREWFVEFRYPGHENVPLVESELGAIPKDWRVRSVQEIAGVNSHTLKPTADLGEILYVDISSVTTGGVSDVTRVEFRDAPGRARRRVHHGDVIWSTVRPNRRSYALLIDPPANLIVSTGFAVLTAEGVPFNFLYRAVTTDEFVGYLTNRATGAAYPAVTGKVFEDAPLVVPPDDLLARFGVAVEPMDVLVARLRMANENLRATRDLLLPRLISGEVDVSNLDIDVGDAAA